MAKKANLEPEPAFPAPAERRWFVCYCGAGKAIPLVRGLVLMGVLAECPSFKFRRRVPRRKRVEVVEKPLIGGIFFLGVESWPPGPGVVAGVRLEFVRRMMAPYGPAVVLDRELDELRMASLRETQDRAELAPGDRVEVCLGPFKGFAGKVLESREDAASIALDGWRFKALVATFLLRRIQR